MPRTRPCHSIAPAFDHGYATSHSQHKRFKTLMDEWAWEQRTDCTKGQGRDASRANVLDFAPWCWPANEKVHAWLEEGWERWEAEPPEW